jgi:hypothetical protein
MKEIWQKVFFNFTISFSLLAIENQGLLLQFCDTKNKENSSKNI